MNNDIEEELANLHRDLGLKRLNPVWAKLEIVGGLFAAGIGLKLLSPNHQRVDVMNDGLALVLFVLGGYLAMAGNRSHLYQSNNLLAAWIVRSRKSDTAVAVDSASKETS
jgi:hypothetical protein